jgi:hypothetical protein
MRKDVDLVYMSIRSVYYPLFNNLANSKDVASLDIVRLHLQIPALSVPSTTLPCRQMDRSLYFES